MIQVQNDLDTHASEYTPGNYIHLEDHSFAVDVQLQGTSFQTVWNDPLVSWVV